VLFRSIETTNEDLSAHPPPISQRQNKPVRAPSTDTKVLPAKPAVTRKTRGKFDNLILKRLKTNRRYILATRTRSEDRFRGSSLSLLNSTGETTTTTTSSSSSSSHSQLPSYAAHTSSSMNKLRDGSLSSTTPPPSSCSNSSTTVVSHPRRVPSTKTIPKSRSTQNLVLPTATAQSNQQLTKPLLPHRVKINRIPRRPPNLPTTNAMQTSTSSSSSSSNSSSPTKLQQHLTETISPSSKLDNSTNDSMPKWAQDCFYRTVVLGLKPLLLQDIPSSPIKHATSSSSIESSDSLETTSEVVVINQKDIQIRRSLSIQDYKQIDTTNNKEK